MRKRMLAVVAAASLVVSIVAPAAYGTPVPPHPPAPPPVVQGSHHPNWTNDGLKAGACVLGGVMLLGSPEKDRVGNELLWTVGCVAGSFLNPAGSIIGGATFLALFSEQGFLTKTFRPGGWRCQPQDVDLVAGCKEYLEGLSLI